MPQNRLGEKGALIATARYPSAARRCHKNLFFLESMFLPTLFYIDNQDEQQAGGGTEFDDEWLRFD